MTLIILIAAFGLVVIGLGMAGIVAGGADLMRRRRGEDREAGVIADSQVEFEADVGRTPPGP